MPRHALILRKSNSEIIGKESFTAQEAGKTKVIHDDASAEEFHGLSCNILIDYRFCAAAEFRDDFGINREFRVGRPDLIKVRSHCFEPLQAADIILHIAVLAKHEDPAMRLHGIAADQHPAADVENGYASGSVPGKMNDLQLPVPKIKLVAVLHGDQLSNAAGFAVVGFIRRV